MTSKTTGLLIAAGVVVAVLVMSQSDARADDGAAASGGGTWRPPPVDDLGNTRPGPQYVLHKNAAGQRVWMHRTVALIMDAGGISGYRKFR